MKTLGPALLLLEAIVVALAVPVALAIDDRGATAAIVLGVLAILLALGSGAVRRPRGVAVGWVLQGLVVLTGFVVPAMALLGLVFLGVWVVGVIYGAKGDALAARNAATEAAWQAEQAKLAAPGAEAGAGVRVADVPEPGSIESADVPASGGAGGEASDVPAPDPGPADAR
jgi:hypothetical protein